MLHIQDNEVRKLLLSGNFGLEKEMLRITDDGHFAHTQHPFPEDEQNITRDFCENQTEINTPIFKSAEAVVENIGSLTRRIQERLDTLSPHERLWQYSNPPYICGEDDIPIALFHGTGEAKTAYRRHLARRYGRYMMTLSGIHFNYSFAGDLLRRNYEVETGIHVVKGKEPDGYRAYCDRMYLHLASQLVSYGWIMVALTAASPLMDGSYFEASRAGEDVFCGMSSVRCSELGYWNEFTPVLDYTDTEHYTQSIQRYVEEGLIAAPSELYYPIRLKPKGANSLAALRENGVNHIELRMIDVNPLYPEGIDLHDVKFAQLLIVWLCAQPPHRLTAVEQMTAVANFKQAARYDLHTSGIVGENGQRMELAAAAARVLDEMGAFFGRLGANADVEQTLAYQQRKLQQPEAYRYADIVRRKYADGLVAQLLADTGQSSVRQYV